MRERSEAQNHTMPAPPPPTILIPPDPAHPSALAFHLAALLARAAPAGEVLGAVRHWGDPAAQAALVSALGDTRGWVGGGGARPSSSSSSSSSYEARILRRVAAAAEAEGPRGGVGGGGDSDDDQGPVSDALAAALAAALLAEGSGGRSPDTTPPWNDAALLFGRPGGPATTVRLRMCTNLLAGDTGCTAWPAAAALGCALAGGAAPEGLAGRHVVELGCGTGALGCLLAAACAPRPASLTLTDGDAGALANARETVARNGWVAAEVEGAADAATPPPLPAISLARLPWGPSPPPGLGAARPGLLVLGADVSYDPASAPALAACVAALLRRGGPGSAALFAGVRRTAGGVAAFEAAAERAGLRVRRWGVAAAASAGRWGAWGGAEGGGADMVGWRLRVEG